MNGVFVCKHTKASHPINFQALPTLTPALSAVYLYALAEGQERVEYILSAFTGDTHTQRPGISRYTLVPLHGSIQQHLGTVVKVKFYWIHFFSSWRFYLLFWLADKWLPRIISLKYRQWQSFDISKILSVCKRTERREQLKRFFFLFFCILQHLLCFTIWLLSKFNSVSALIFSTKPNLIIK